MLGPGAQDPSIQELGTSGDPEAGTQSIGPHTREWDGPTECHSQGSTTVFILHCARVYGSQGDLYPELRASRSSV